jgi:transposase InsO family protein
MCLQPSRYSSREFIMSLRAPSRKVRSNNRNEFKNTRIDDLCDDFRIRHQFSSKYTQQSNGLVERKNRTLIDMARSMLSEYNMCNTSGV